MEALLRKMTILQSNNHINVIGLSFVKKFNQRGVHRDTVACGL